jgi:hypothetical protein
MLDADRIFRKAEAAGEFRGAVAACRELREQIELFARLTGEIQDRQVNLNAVNITEAFLLRPPTPPALPASQGNESP